MRNVTLTLTRVSGKGTSGDVQVDLYGTKVTEPSRSNVPDSNANLVSFGGSAQIGTIGNGETKVFTIPVAAVTNSAVKGLMLQVSDTTVKSGKGYSANYAKFYGAGDDYAPVLTVVGQ